MTNLYIFLNLDTKNLSKSICQYQIIHIIRTRYEILLYVIGKHRWKFNGLILVISFYYKLYQKLILPFYWKVENITGGDNEYIRLRYCKIFHFHFMIKYDASTVLDTLIFNLSKKICYIMGVSEEPTISDKINNNICWK